jgi:hypothetical protein
MNTNDDSMNEEQREKLQRRWQEEQAPRRAAPFHGRVCGECAWSAPIDTTCEFAPCRRVGRGETKNWAGWCAVRPSWPACPSSVQKGAPE